MIFLNDAKMSRLICLIAFEKNYRFLLMLLNMMCLVHQVAVTVKQNKGLGDASHSGICHSYTEDGRCVSLLKILFSNVCIFDCAYCVSRRSNDVQRAAFTVQEVVDLTINFTAVIILKVYF